MEAEIKRFDGAPTVGALKAIAGITDEQIARVRAVLSREIDPEEASPDCAKWVGQCHNRPSWHERALEACNEILEGYGVVSLNVEDANWHTDSGVRFCPPFSYVNFGDTYAVTLGRDHEDGSWVVACWGDMLEDYEREHKIGDFEEYEEEPDECRDCGERAFTLETFERGEWRGGVRVDAGMGYTYVCDACNTHHTTPEGWTPPEVEEVEEDQP